jgi:esterase/lipase
MKKITFITAIGITVLISVVYLSGPRLTIDTTLKKTAIPEDLALYLSQKESRFTDITPGTEAKIIWADTMRSRSYFSLVYLHGFSATRRETAPLCDSIAAALDANLYYPRLTGHGRTGATLATATVNDWLNDANEAVEIGRRLGDKLIVIGNSTGATLAIWIASRQENPDIFALILISPNLGLKDKRARLLLTPWARYTIPVLVGKNSGFTPFNRAHEKYWTSRYPTTALLPMMGLVKLARSCQPARVTVPVMVIYSPNDKVLDIHAVERFYDGLSSPRKHILPVVNTGNEECHVIAGDILSPGTTQHVAEEIIQFVKKNTLPEKG